MASELTWNEVHVMFSFLADIRPTNSAAKNTHILTNYIEHFDWNKMISNFLSTVFSSPWFRFCSSWFIQSAKADQTKLCRSSCQKQHRFSRKNRNDLHSQSKYFPLLRFIFLPVCSFVHLWRSGQHASCQRRNRQRCLGSWRPRTRQRCRHWILHFAWTAIFSWRWRQNRHDWRNGFRNRTQNDSNHRLWRNASLHPEQKHYHRQQHVSQWHARSGRYSARSFKRRGRNEKIIADANEELVPTLEDLTKMPQILGTVDLGSGDLVLRVVAYAKNGAQYAISRTLRDRYLDDLKEHGFNIPTSPLSLTK